VAVAANSRGVGMASQAVIPTDQPAAGSRGVTPPMQQRSTPCSARKRSALDTSGLLPNSRRTSLSRTSAYRVVAGGGGRGVGGAQRARASGCRQGVTGLGEHRGTPVPPAVASRGAALPSPLRPPTWTRICRLKRCTRVSWPGCMPEGCKEIMQAMGHAYDAKRACPCK
jgi:hypothetical protein